MIDPQEVARRLPPATSSVAPIPTVIPTATPIVQKATAAGEQTLWVVCVVMAISSLTFYAMAYRVPVQKRLFHIITALITTFAFLSYYAMATGGGTRFNHIVITESHKHGIPDTYQDVYREVFWARYVDWSLTTPLLLLDLSLLAGLNGANTLVTIVADLIMILSGLFAALEPREAPKWGWYAWACIAFLVIVWQLVVYGRAAVSAQDGKTKTFFTAIALYTLVIWLLYPIIWGIADGSRTIDVNSEIIAYAVLDILAKPVFGLWLLFTHDARPQTSLTVEGYWANGLGKDGTIRVGDDDEGA